MLLYKTVAFNSLNLKQQVYLLQGRSLQIFLQLLKAVELKKKKFINRSLRREASLK